MSGVPPASPTRGEAPWSISFVVAAVDPELTVAALVESLQPQLSADLRCELVLVGMPLVAELAAWRDAGGRVVELAVADHLDVGARRRAGLAAATGRWVAFPQPDAAYGPGTLAAVRAATAQFPGLDVLAVRPYRRDVRSGRVRDTHPDRGVFDRRDAVVDLDAAGEDYSPSHLGSTVFRTASARARSRWLLAPINSFEDALFLAAMLFPTPTRARLGIVAGGAYFQPLRGYRDRETELFRASATSYLSRVCAGADLLAESSPPFPRALVTGLLFELHALLRMERVTPLRAVSLSTEDRRVLVDQMAAILASLGPEAVHGYAHRPMATEIRQVMRGWSGEPLPGDGDLRIRRRDVRTGEVLVAYPFTGAAAEHEFTTADGAPCPPTHAKTRGLDYFGQRIVRERLSWHAADPVTVTLDGVIRAIEQPAASSAGRGLRLRARYRGARRSWLSRAALVRALASLPPAQRRHGDAWVLMDRADLAGDNAEHFYRWLAANAPHIKAHFVVRKDSVDYARLVSEGFRMVPYGSLRHQLLLHSAREYLSSHAGVDVMRPAGDRLAATRRRWRFTFLQHGVIHNDLSTWLNNQHSVIDVFLTSTEDEHRAIIGDDSPYVYTERCVKPIGIPRHDRLRRLADARPLEDRRTILFAPTWRNSLFVPGNRPGERRTPRPDFARSRYVQDILDLLGNHQLRRLCEARGLDFVFLPHPNVGPHFPADLIPGWVKVAGYADGDVQETLAQCRVFVTDFSSVAFDAAYAHASVVYLQTEESIGADHTVHPGYFDFTRDGFGPVCATAEGAIQAIEAALDGADEAYRSRVREAFLHWDGENSRRLFELLTG